jgi:predicted short-subunit dehydrogenase-like oxidoreductase (DUF2520 family)
MNLGFIGAGRVGTALATSFSAAGYRIVALASRNPQAAETLARRIPGARAVRDPAAVAGLADLVFLTVPDDAIAAVTSRLPWRPGMGCVHCSGAAGLEVLRAAAEHGAETGGFHPLRMFGNPGEAIASLQGTAVAIAGSERLLPRLEEIARRIGARSFRLPEDMRALYHASANFVGAFVVALMQETIELWRQLGVDEKDAIAALTPLLRSTADQMERFGTAGGLGSAVARGDVGTIRKHLAALAAHAPESLPIYRLLSLRTIPIALAKGTLPPETAREIEALLRAEAPQARPGKGL